MNLTAEMRKAWGREEPSRETSNKRLVKWS